MVERRIRVVLDPTSVRSGSEQARQSLRRLHTEATETRQELRGIVLTDSRGNIIRPAQAARREIARLGDEADRSQLSFGGLTSRIFAIAGAAYTLNRAVGAVVEYADAWTLTGNRLRLVTSSSQELERVQRDLLNLAQETFNAYGPTVELYARLSRATQELNLSDRTRLALTRAINQAVAISGATTQEASAGLIQFAQGLASGRFQGEELRAVLEQIPRLARSIADGLGVTVGELRRLGSEGLLTPQAIIRALAADIDSLNSEFQNINATSQQAGQSISDAFGSLVGSLDEVLGLSEAISGSLSLTAQRIRVAAGQGTEIDRLQVQVRDLRRELEGAERAPIFIRSEERIVALRAEISTLETQIAELQRTQVNQAAVQEEVANLTVKSADADKAAAQAARIRAQALGEVTAQLQSYQDSISASISRAEDAEASAQVFQTIGDFIEDTNRAALAATSSVTGLGNAWERGATQGREILDTLQGQIEAAEEAERVQAELAEQMAETARENRRFAETLAGSFNSALEDAIFQGQGFGSVLRSLGEDLARLIIRITIFRPLAESLAAVFGSVGQGGGGGGVLRSFLGALISGITGGIGGTGSGGGGGETSSARGFVGSFQRGGSFVVPGTGGPDSRDVSFRATPGERVTISPADQAPTVNVYNYAGDDTSVETEARTGPSGQQVIDVIFRRNLERLASNGGLDKVLGARFGLRPQGIARY